MIFRTQHEAEYAFDIEQKTSTSGFQCHSKSMTIVIKSPVPKSMEDTQTLLVGNYCNDLNPRARICEVSQP